LDFDTFVVDFDI